MTGSLFIIVADIGLFALVVFGAWLAVRRVEAEMAVRRRLRGIGAPAAPSRRVSLIRRQEVRNPVLAWVQKASLTDPKERQKLRQDLVQAGFTSQSAPAWYVVIRFTLAVGLPLAFVFAQKFMATPATGMKLMIFPLILCGVGLITPSAFVSNRAGARRTELEHEFPDTLDMMVVCVEAGLGLEGALVRVGEETATSHPRMALEFQIVSLELRAGRTRVEALRNLADRTQVDMVKSFVALMIQTDALGVSIGQSLRTYSAEMRQHRMLKAEEKAMRLPVLLTIPLVMFILPVVCAAVMLPPAIDVIRNFLPAMGGK